MSYFQPGRPLVVREDGEEGLATVYDVCEASGGRMFHELRKRRDTPWLWLPVI